MPTRRSKEDLGGLTLDQLLSLVPSAGPDGPVWAPDGSCIYIKSLLGGSANIWQVDMAAGLTQRITTDLGVLPFLSPSLVDCSPDGRWVSYIGDKSPNDGRERSSRVEIWLQPTDGTAERQLTHLGANVNAYRWAPDSRSIVLSSNRQGRYDIYRVQVPSGQVKRLTHDPLYEVYPTFTPSGEQILYVRLDEAWADHEIMLMTADGEWVRSVAKDTDFFDYIYGRRFGYPVVSPDGEMVCFPSHRSHWINYWWVSMAGGEPQPVYAEASDQSDATFSPDGRFLALVSNVNGTMHLTVVSLQAKAGEAQARVLVAPAQGVVSRPAWSPDGEQIAYLLETPTGPADLWVVSVETGAARRLTCSPLGLADKLTTPEKITYRSFDSLKIPAYLYAPPHRKAGERFPGLVMVHGGPTSQFSDTYAASVQYFIRKGYVVLMPNIRGSTGYGKTFEDLNNRDWGHGDLRDVIAGVEYLRTLDYVDGTKMAVHGTSYGGCMSMSAVAFAPGVFQAAVPHAGYGDWLDFEDEQELRHRQLMCYEFGDPEKDREVYRRCSPIYELAKATTPVFLVHGEGRYPRSNASLKFARALERDYKVYDYKVYPNECYYVTSKDNLAEMYPDIVEFLERYLTG